ncbi:GTP 3',8-cyclase MoaA [Sulfolobus sp. S-194]|uniref:GTP 3',8-cyclase MoaA n=1 Tax=Sulfolobus sp. S-194 TaxID=2512240 RepID=UPI001436EEFD|nr:GTP 3',8-cyclase MoaA [Sulfolobus sp. S-194]QIW24261.1 GTP 3',8-cyclase MoaA [Sulfolobus sp. S-194]
MIDRFGRPIEDLRVTLTHVCNFSCFFCHMEGEDSSQSLLSPEEISLVAKVGIEYGIRSVKLTGGEPTLRRDLVQIIKELKDKGIKEVSMTTNGVLLSTLAWKLKEAGLDRVNVSLHSLDKQLFKEITGVDALDKVIDGIKEAIKAGLRPLKLNFVLTKKNISQLDNIINFAIETGVDELHLIELHPVGLGKNTFEYHEKLESIEKILKEKADKIEIRSKHYRPRYHLNNLVIEVVKPYANPIFCAGCNRIRLTADGKLKTCLYRQDKEIDIIDILRGNFSLEEKIELIREAYEIAIAIREPNFKYRVENYASS